MLSTLSILFASFESFLESMSEDWAESGEAYEDSVDVVY